uniref:Ubiquitin carboxyl-terminal hydrolase n=1 Tax=Arcella intermedia TaxID=1963864 RepID=A0A6B2LGV6_9EUKA
MNNFASQLGLNSKFVFCDVIDMESGTLMLGDDIVVGTDVLSYIFLFPSKAKVVQNFADYPWKPQDLPFFLEQVDDLQDACGTVALIHSLGQNRAKIGLEDGTVLGQFLKSVANLSFNERGLALAKNDSIRALHCSAVSDERSATRQVEVGATDNHFVCFTTTKVGGDTWIVELDGRKQYPIFHQVLPEGGSFGAIAGAVIKNTYMKDPSITEFATVALTSIN